MKIRTLFMLSALICVLAIYQIVNGEFSAIMTSAPLMLGGFLQPTGIKWAEFSKYAGNPAAIKAVAANITEFFQQPLMKQLAWQKALASMDPNLMSEKPVVSVHGDDKHTDFGYMEIFEPVDMTESNNTSFEVLNLTNAITFEQIVEGERIKIRKIGSSKAEVSYLMFGAGLGFLDTWFRFNKYYLMDQILNRVRNESYTNKAKFHYDLITAVTGITENFTVDDASTIDAAIANILNDNKDKGYFSSEDVPFIVLANPTLKRRLTKAIWPFTVNKNDTTSQGPVHNVKRLVTSYNVPTGNYWVILPGNKIQSGTWDHLNAESKRDAMRRAEDISYEEKFNAIVGDAKQLKKCNLA